MFFSSFFFFVQSYFVRLVAGWADGWFDWNIFCRFVQFVLFSFFWWLIRFLVFCFICRSQCPPADNICSKFQIQPWVRNEQSEKWKIKQQKRAPTLIVDHFTSFSFVSLSSVCVGPVFRRWFLSLSFPFRFDSIHSHHITHY